MSAVVLPWLTGPTLWPSNSNSSLLWLTNAKKWWATSSPLSKSDCPCCANSLCTSMKAVLLSNRRPRSSGDKSLASSKNFFKIPFSSRSILQRIKCVHSIKSLMKLMFVPLTHHNLLCRGPMPLCRTHSVRIASWRTCCLDMGALCVCVTCNICQTVNDSCIIRAYVYRGNICAYVA